MKYFPIAISAALATSCASLGKTEKNDKITLSDTSATELETVKSHEVAGKDAYAFGETEFAVEWLGCKTKGAKATIIIHHPEGEPFAGPAFCQQWQPQVFLTSGFDVIAVNRPGHGASTGEADFAGAHSVAAISKALESAPKQGQFPQKVTGMWGYAAGATAAAVAAKYNKGLEFLILGNGFYDMEQTMSQSTSPSVKSSLEAVTEKEADQGIEYRSVAWDPSNLPKQVLLYHGKNDDVVLPTQAETFRDSLASGQYKVTLQVIDGIAHEIPAAHHQQIVKILAASVAR